LAWLSDDNASRLVTTAKTRQQRASRAFGAELLAPAKFINKRLGTEQDVSPFTLDKISNEIGVASTIVRLQAQNNGYRILDAA
jgi:Zn-dependent peptidase ImmA (M78 family)